MLIFVFYLLTFSRVCSVNFSVFDTYWFHLLAAMGGLSLGEKNFIKGGIAQDLRTDGRKRLTYRPIYVETGVIPQV